MTDTVRLSLEGSVLIVELNRPERLNAINTKMIQELHTAVCDAQTNDAVRVVLLRGAGRAFCSGDDLIDTAEHAVKDQSSDSAANLTDQLQDISRQLVMGKKPVVAAVHGWAVGAGFEWAINSDISLWADDCRAFFPEIQWGLFPTGGVMTLLPRIVGLTKAREMLFLGEKYSASELHELGLAWKVVPAGEVQQASLELAMQLAELPARALSECKRTLNHALFQDFSETLNAEAQVIEELLDDPETIERIRTFNK